MQEERHRNNNAKEETQQNVMMVVKSVVGRNGGTCEFWTRKEQQNERTKDKKGKEWKRDENNTDSHECVEKERAAQEGEPGQERQKKL